MLRYYLNYERNIIDNLQFSQIIVLNIYIKLLILFSTFSNKEKHLSNF